MLRPVFSQGLRLAAAGLRVGLAIAYALMRVLASLLFGVKAVDPLTSGGVALILVLVALSGPLVPSAAVAVDPSSSARPVNYWIGAHSASGLGCRVNITV